jgi:hypothetical protein
MLSVSVEEPRPRIGGVCEGQDFGSAFPDAPVNFDQLALGQDASPWIADNPYAIPSVPERPTVIIECYFD